MRSIYLSEVLSGRGLAKTVKEVARVLAPYKDDFQAIAFRGVSGALVAPSVAAILKRDLIVARKPTDNAHSSMLAEGPERAVKYMSSLTISLLAARPSVKSSKPLTTSTAITFA